ncbi:hypothetical protein [Streptomyces globisporus]|uniref:hypothetical protein n=1 Tax=Streptomyces globisporus TaxID=1908 RepID=UPI001FC905E1|nr:hypothetical protein [Streptomyces globisporus]
MAARTVERRGRAANVVRMVPLLYSPVITSAPTTAASIWATTESVRLPPRTVSSDWRLPVAATNTAPRTGSRAVATVVHTVERTLRNLIHS